MIGPSFLIWSQDLLEYIQSRFFSSCKSIKTFAFSTLYTYTIIPYSEGKDTLQQLVQLCFIKLIVQCRYTYIVLVRVKSDVFKNKSTLILIKSFLKLTSSKCSTFSLSTYLLCLVGAFFNTQSEFPWVSSVFLFLPILKHNSWKGFVRKIKVKLARSVK